MELPTLTTPLRPNRVKNLAGKRFGKWLVLSFAGMQGAYSAWNCNCDCGTSRVVVGHNMVKGESASCGCVQREKLICRNLKHGETRGGTPSRVHRIWHGMIQRCTNPNNPGFDNYGGRGIAVDSRWFIFENFLADMGYPPVAHSLERVDNDKGYSKSNCIWATSAVQSRNTSRNHILTLHGKTMLLVDWIAETGLTGPTIIRRLQAGWTVEDALTRSPQGKTKKNS